MGERFGDRIVLVDLQPNRREGHALAEGIRRASGVTLSGLVALGKQDKHGWSVAVKEYSGEVLEVTREVATAGLARFAE